VLAAGGKQRFLFILLDLGAFLEFSVSIL